MSRAVKYTFDTRFDEDFGDRRATAAAQRTAEELEQIRMESFQAGMSMGQQQAAANAQDEFGASMTNFAASAASLLVALDAERLALRRESVAVALMAARKLVPALIASRPEAEIEATLRDCLPHLNREPNIVLRVSENLVGRLRDIVDRMALERGLTGRIVLLAQEGLADGDCVVEWADGGLERSRAVIEREIDAAVSRYIETLGDSHASGAHDPIRAGQSNFF